MMSRILKKFMAQVTKGKLEFHGDERKQFSDNLNHFEGQWVWITIDRISKIRTMPQNKYYWGVVIKILSDHIGYTKDEMHSALKMQFLIVVDDDKPLPTTKSTADLVTLAFEEYLQEVREWALTELGIDIPLPNEIEVIE